METPKTQAIRYVDFDVYLTAKESNGETKIFAELDCRDSNGNSVVHLLKPCELRKLGNHPPPYSTQANDHQDVVRYGSELYSSLFDGELRDKISIVLSRNYPLVRIGISSRDSRLPNYFWEVICKRMNVENFLSLNKEFSVARILRHESPSNLRLLDGPLKILIGHASPHGPATIPLEQAKEFKSIAEHRGHKAEVLGKLNFDSIQKFFDADSSDSLHVVHLICHGKSINENSCLIFERDDGHRCYIDASVLAQALKRVSPYLVILQACKSGETNAESDFMTGVAETLVSHGIPSVLAFRGEPDIDFAFDFFKEMYNTWLQGQVSLEYALQRARLCIRDKQTNSKQQRPIDAWSLPVLYRQPGVFLEIRHTHRPPEPLEDIRIDFLTDLLKSCNNLFENIKKAGVLSVQQNPDQEAVAKEFINHKCPIKLLSEIVYAWGRSSGDYLFEAQDAFEFHAIKDFLVVHSLPIECQKHVSEAIKVALDRASDDRTMKETIKLGSQKVLEDKLKQLVYWTWLNLTEEKDQLQDALKALLNPRYTEQNSRILRSVKFINEPELTEDAQFKKGLEIKFVAQHILDEIRGHKQKITDPVLRLRERLEEFRNKKTVVVMLVRTNARLKAFLDLLRDEFGSDISCVYLESSEQGNIFSSIYDALEDINNGLPKVYQDNGS